MQEPTNFHLWIHLFQTLGQKHEVVVMTPHHISFLCIYNKLPAHNQRWHQLSDECCSSITPLVKAQSFELKRSTFFFSKLLHQMAGGGAQLSLIFLFTGKPNSIWNPSPTEMLLIISLRERQTDQTKEALLYLILREDNICKQLICILVCCKL